MATAVQPADTPPAVASPRARLVAASFVGALFVLGGLVLAGYVVPMLWAGSAAASMGLVGGFLRIVVQIAVAGGVAYAGASLAGLNPPKGLRGGIFLCVSVVVAVFFVARAVGLNFNDSPVGPYLTLAVLAALVFAGYKYLTSDRGERAMVGLEEQGWFHLHTFKKTQGLKVRRWTLIGILLVGFTGAYALYVHRSLGSGDWKLAMPFGLPTVVPLTPIQYAAPFLVALGTFWFAWRLVNVPTFADFLIATEAEMNKVSWSTRRRLWQDTVVVLVTLAIMTLFLFLVDVFWGWLLSTKVVGVLPAKKDTKELKTANEKLSW